MRSILPQRMFAACFLLALITHTAFAQAARPAASAEAEIKKLEREWFDAAVKSDRAALERIFADDFSATNSSGAFINKSEMVAEMTSGRFKLDELKSEDFKLRLYGNTAVATGKTTFVRAGRALGQASYTAMWVKRAGRWQAVSWQTTTIGRGNAPAATNASAQPTEAGKAEKKMYGLIGKMTAVAGKREELIAILLEGVSNMPGCLSYVVARDQADANAIWITEVWDSAQSHQASLALPAVQQAIARARPLIASFSNATTTEPAGGHGLRPR